MYIEQRKTQQRSEKTVKLPQLSVILLLGVFFVGLTWANHQFLTGSSQYVDRDYMSLWTGGRAVLEGLNPYDTAVWGPLRLQYGSEWIPDSRAPFPLWTFLFHLPFSALDLNWGAATWLSLAVALLVSTLFLLINQLSDGLLPVGQFAVLVAGAFLFRGSVIALRGGQITFLLLFVLVLFWTLLRRGRSFWAGFSLAFILFKPNPFVLLAPLLALWLVWRRDWRAVGGG